MGGRQLCYRPSGERERVPERSSDRASGRNSRNACAHDGECNLNGCGNVCNSYRFGPMVTNCFGDESLDEAQFCGCVQGECGFFRQ